MSLDWFPGHYLSCVLAGDGVDVTEEALASLR